ncbi:hypothetical protein ATKI12_5853 [Kitasatospora sp. Ki12]|uniref:hypothetical protein n=1 Tax=Kitasatospora xanthocidica TaxID=83382 RepID=UPI0016777394|nr:hypothetical protein [Kitasatospora xanthocidica]GHF53178.1 hypothetical protein GCM10018790_33670 [Kitasatospora xanthocidica]
MARLTWTSPRTWTAVAGALLVTATFGLATAPPAGAVTTTVVRGTPAASGTVSSATCTGDSVLIAGGFDLGTVAVDPSTGAAPAVLVTLNGPSTDRSNTWEAAAVGVNGAQALALCQTG